MSNPVEYQAIFETETHTFYVCYEPSQNGEIFITSVVIEPRPVSLFEIRNMQIRRRHGLQLDEQEEHAEMMQPYTRKESQRLP